MYCVDLRVQLVGGVHYLRTHVVDGETPLLIVRKTMTCMRMRVDTARSEVMVNVGRADRLVRCVTSSAVHLLVRLWDSGHRDRASLSLRSYLLK